MVNVMTTPKKFEEFNADDRIGIRLLENSVHFLVGEIDENNIHDCIQWIVYENLRPTSNKTLTLYINSTGGDLYQAFALIDIMRYSQLPIRTIGIGACMSAAFLIFASGTTGERYAAPNTSFMCHQFSSGGEAKYHDIKAEMKENDSLNAKMIDILRDATALAPSVIKKKLLPASDVFLTAQEAIDLGIADQLLSADNE
jgi:ATP-dependent Clp protease, protease subunit